VWTQELLERSPERELAIACCKKLSPVERRLAWERYEVKKMYELLCGGPVKLDLNDLEPQMASEVAEMRRLSRAKVPWVDGDREYSDLDLPVPPLPRSENPLRHGDPNLDPSLNPNFWRGGAW
jgi:hypothetical protein